MFSPQPESLEDIEREPCESVCAAFGECRSRASGVAEMVSYLEDRQALVKDLKHLTNVCVSYAKVQARS